MPATKEAILPSDRIRSAEDAVGILVALPLHEGGEGFLITDSERYEFEGDTSRLRQELQERAYYLWQEECRRVGGEVHGNDLHHWFQAEFQTRSHLSDRSQEMTTSKKRSVSKATPVMPTMGRNAVGSSRPATAGGQTAANGDAADLVVQVISKDGEVSVMSALDAEPPIEDAVRFAIRELPAMTVDCDLKEPVNLLAPEFAGKIIATDQEESEVLAVADSYDELSSIVTGPAFLAKLARFGDNAQFLIHSGPTKSVVQ